MHDRLCLPCSNRPFPSVLLGHMPHKSIFALVTCILFVLRSMCCSELFCSCFHQRSHVVQGFIQTRLVNYTLIYIYIYIYTLRSKSFKTDVFKNRRHMRKTNTFFLLKIRSIDIYRLLRGRTVSEKLPEIPLFGPSLIHQLRLLGSQ